jgi:hypothetical protein
MVSFLTSGGTDMKEKVYYLKIIMNIYKTSDVEGKDWYQLKRSNRFMVVGSLDGNIGLQ